MSANAAHFDDNQIPTTMGAIGTLGTADTGGTAKALPLSVDGTTGAAHVYLITKLDSTNDSVTIGAGTVTSVTNLAGGTVRHNEIPVNIGTSYGTVGTTGAAVWGTLIAASGAGTYQYVSGVDVVVASGTVDVAVTNIGIGGSTGAGILARGQFTPGGGISKDFDPIIRSGTNGTISYWLGGAGTAAITVQYWQGI